MSENFDAPPVPPTMSPTMALAKLMIYALAAYGLGTILINMLKVHGVI